MKFVIDERIKHRLTGLVVIVSIAAIFVPAMMKKSNQHLDEKVNLSVRLPSKPLAPKVLIAGEKALFQSVKVAHVDIQSVGAAPHDTQMVKAEPLSIKSTVPSVVAALNKGPGLAEKTNNVLTTSIKVAAVAAPIKLVQSIDLKNKLLAHKKETYAVQLASFSQQNNARLLVTKLRKQGYKASYNKFSGKQGEFYKVMVGELDQKDEAITLQRQLASSLQLNGFIVKNGIS